MFMQVWTHRVMIAGLVRRDLRARYAGSMLGVLWTLLHPLLLLLVYVFVFSTILQVRFTPEGGSLSFSLHLLAGLLPWLAFQEGVLKATTAIVDNAGVVKSTHFPTVVLVMSSVVAAGVTFLVSLTLLVVALLVAGYGSWLYLPYLPVLVFLQTVLTLGFSLFTASLHTLVRDTIPVLQMILMVWFYLTPIIYPLSYVPDRWAMVFGWNPITPLINAYRAVLLEGKMPSAAELLPSCVWAIAFLWFGRLVFSRVEPIFADVV
jgi:ABC-type polysaccharide/polyol phosphate export permease